MIYNVIVKYLRPLKQQKASVFLSPDKEQAGKMMGEFDSVMQIRDKVEGLHNFGEFSHPSSVYLLLCNHTFVQ